jgi:hypothetical protein
MSLSDVRGALLAELRLLAQCDGIKEFDKFIKEGDIKGIHSMFLNVYLLNLLTY